jgi:hypothetical protein
VLSFAKLERVWRNGSASASQAEGCGFESRRPLQDVQKSVSPYNPI